MPVSPYDFDLEFFRAVFPTAPAHGDRTYLTYMCSPACLVDVEHYRGQLATDLVGRKRYPCDVFTWGSGPPADRDVTLLGGLPYRPSSAAWPHDDRGRPKAFLGQVRFVESRDIVGEQPGDLLLLFVEPEERCNAWWPKSFTLEWQRLGIRDLATERDVPQTAVKVPHWYGVRHRTFDVDAPFSTAAVESVMPVADQADPESESWGKRLARLHATKIGGLLPFDWESRVSFDSPLCFLLTSLYPSFWAKFPFTNRPEPFSGNEVYTQRFVPGGDSFSLAILRDGGTQQNVQIIVDYGDAWRPDSEDA